VYNDPLSLSQQIRRLNIEKAQLLTLNERDEVDRLIHKIQEPSERINFLHDFIMFLEHYLNYNIIENYNIIVTPTSQSCTISQLLYYMVVNNVLHGRSIIDAVEPVPKKARAANI
jgi:phosphoketolase